MDSVPPATITSAPPLMMRSAAIAIACKPEEQKRLMVSAETSTGSPARSEAMRATFIPCSASGMAQPRMVARSVPLKARPTGVRTEDARMTSRIKGLDPRLPLSLYSMLGIQHELHLAGA